MPTYNPKDVVIIQRNSTSSSFVEVVLSSLPNSYLSFDSASNVKAISTQSLIESAINQVIKTGSIYPITSSWSINAISASYAPGGSGGTTLVTGSIYPITSSWGIESIGSTTADFSLDSQFSVSSSYSLYSNNGGNSPFYRYADGYILYKSASVYSLTNNDDGYIISLLHDDTIQINLSMSLNPNFSCTLFQSGSGKLIIKSELNNSILSLLNRTGSIGQYSIIKIFRMTNGNYILSGDLM